VIRVDAIGAAVAEETDQHHFVHEYDKKYSAVAKREIICADTGAPRFVGIIQRLAHPGARGDDRIHVSIVNEATNIRTSAHSEAAFCTPLSGARNP
jgi:nitrogen regulatory protein PII